MIKAIKLRLLPTLGQEQRMWQSAGTARWAYNWALDRQINHFKSTGKLTKISDNKLRKALTQLKKQNSLKWLYEVSNNVTKQAVKDLCAAIDRFHKISQQAGYQYRTSAIKKGKPLTFQDFKHFPCFKSRKRTEPGFYNDTHKFKAQKDSVYLEKIGWIKTSETNKLPDNIKYNNPRIKHDGKYWYLTVGIEVKEEAVKLNNLSIGIDLGIKELAVCSHNDSPIKNINKTQRVRKLEKKLKRFQRKVSGKYQKNKDGDKFVKTKNIAKLEKQIKLLHRKLANIRLNHTHQATAGIVKAKPSRVVMETLNIQGMMKNKHLSKAIQEQRLYDFRRQMQYKCQFNNIEFVEADRWYPSSKQCSRCGHIKKDLKLSDRKYICQECGLKIDRDKNAAINLSKYQSIV